MMKRQPSYVSNNSYAYALKHSLNDNDKDEESDESLDFSVLDGPSEKTHHVRERRDSVLNRF